MEDEVINLKINPLGLDEEFYKVEKGEYTLRVWIRDFEGNEKRKEGEIKLDDNYG
jgi:hypothetical protein